MWCKEVVWVKLAQDRTVGNMVITLVGIINSQKSVQQRGEYIYEKGFPRHSYLFIYLFILRQINV